MRLPGRFELKILGALGFVAILCLGAAAYVLAYIDRSVTGYVDRQQEAVNAPLESALEVFRAYFAERKEEFRRRAAAVAAAPPARLSELAHEPGLLRARLLDGERVLDEWNAPPDELARSREAPPTLVEAAGSRPEAPRVLELTYGIPEDIYGNFLALRNAMQRGRELDRVHPALFPVVFRGYIFASVVLVVLAAGLGLVVARRVTGRLAALQDAARRVGEGDLSVRLEARGRDELDDLARAFDGMVAELREARSRLAYLTKVSAWQEVARRLAHEIKNPLTPIQLAVQQLASQYTGDDASYRRMLDTAQEILRDEINALRRLVDDFSAFAKLPKVEPQAVDLAVVVEEFVRAHAEWEAHVRFRRPDAPVPALCDRLLLRRVLANLVENAIQAAEGAGRTPEVVLTVESRGPRRAALLVDDNGPGVPERDRDRIFDPYVTTKESGTGLGLAIVRKIVIDHGGDVHVEAAPAPLGGARFVVTLRATEVPFGDTIPP